MTGLVKLLVGLKFELAGTVPEPIKLLLLELVNLLVGAILSVGIWRLMEAQRREMLRLIMRGILKDFVVKPVVVLVLHVKRRMPCEVINGINGHKVLKCLLMDLLIS